jgi:type II secretory pathway pseudopilin PulG
VESRAAFTAVETLVAIGILSLLAALLFPALQACRESARRAHCTNNLRQIGTALILFQTIQGHFPPGRDGYYERDHSWCTAILPQLEWTDLRQRYDYGRPWHDGLARRPAHPFPGLGGIVLPGTNAEVAATSLAIFQCPSGENWPGCTDYGGNYGSTLTGLPPGFGRTEGWSAGVLVAVNLAVPEDAPRHAVNLSDVRDGAAHTFIVLEDADVPPDQGGLWANGHNCFAHDGGRINGQRSNEIFSNHPGGAHALFTDGRAQFLRDDMEPAILGALCTRARSDAIRE